MQSAWEQGWQVSIKSRVGGAQLQGLQQERTCMDRVASGCTKPLPLLQAPNPDPGRRSSLDSHTASQAPVHSISGSWREPGKSAGCRRLAFHPVLYPYQQGPRAFSASGCHLLGLFCTGGACICMYMSALVHGVCVCVCDCTCDCTHVACVVSAAFTNMYECKRSESPSVVFDSLLSRGL